MDLLIRIIFGAPGFALAIMIHEASHALAALKLGDPTAKNAGRISLNPRRHFDAMGAIVYVALMVFTRGRFAIGWAKPVPINPYNFRDHRRDFMLSSLAGPVANLAQALVWALLMRAYAAARGVPPFVVLQRSESAADPVAFMIFFGILINVVLAVFNLIPIPPLDGSRVLGWMLPERYAYRLDQVERYGILIVLGLLFFVPGVFNAWMSTFADPLINLFVKVAGAMS